MTAERADASRPSPPPGPPGAGLRRVAPHVATATVTFCVLLWTGGADREGDISALLQGPDDFLRMVQVTDWLDGQGWSDLTQRRLDPPAGVAMHWSRLADLPVAAAVRVAETWSGRAGAVHLAALLVPPLLGALFAAAYLYAAIPLTPDRRAPAPVLMTGALLYPLVQFRPGRIDHHGIQLVLTALAIGLLIRVVEAGRTRDAAVLGIAGGVSLAIGLETLPFLATTALVLGVIWTLHGGPAAKGLATFGLSLAGTSLALLPLTLPPSEWTAIACDRMSLAHVATSAVVPAAGIGAVVLARVRPGAGPPARLAVVGGIGAAGLVLAAALFPRCARGPYADLSPGVRYWFDLVWETRSLPDLLREQPEMAVSALVLPAAALVLLAARWMRSDDRANPQPIALFLLLSSSVALLVWQYRGVAHAGLVAGLALIPFAAAVVARSRRLKRYPTRAGLRLSIPAACVAAILLPLLLAPPESGHAESRCEVRPVLAALTDPAGLGSEARTIAAPIDLGPRILLLTPHRVLAAPYHRNTGGLTDHRRIFGGNGDEALATVRARGVGAILHCRKYAHVTTRPDRPASLAERLGAGRPPSWLVTVWRDEDMGLYRVRPEAE